LPERITFSIIQGFIGSLRSFLHGRVRPDPAAVGALAGRLQDKLIYHSNHLEEIVAARTEACGRSQSATSSRPAAPTTGLWDWDLVTAARSSIRPGGRKRSATTTAGWGIPGGLARSAVHPEDRPGLEARIKSHLAGGTAHLVAEYRIRHADRLPSLDAVTGIAVRDGPRRRPTLRGLADPTSTSRRGWRSS